MMERNQQKSKEAPGTREFRPLTAAEIEEVSGGVGVPGAVVGAIVGGVAYGLDSGFGGGGSWTGLGVAVGMGALVGATGGALTAGQALWGFNATMFGSTVNGIVRAVKNR